MGLIYVWELGWRVWGVVWGVGCEVKWGDYKMFTLAQNLAYICRGAKQQGCIVELSSIVVLFLGQSVSCPLFLAKLVENIIFSFQFD